MDAAADRERRGKPGEGFPVTGTEGPAEEERGTAEAGAQEHGALAETLPADRAGWEDAAPAGGSAGDAGEPSDRPT